MNNSGLVTLRDMLFDGNQDPDHPAIVSPGYQPLTYHDLRLQVYDTVKTLCSMGFHRNDRIAVTAPSGPETAVSIISIMAGFTSLPLNPQNKAQEFDTYFSKFKINGMVVQKNLNTAARSAAATRDIPVIELTAVSRKAGRFTLAAGLPQEPNEAVYGLPSDIATLIPTSGTTSTPKIVPYSQELLSEITHMSRDLNHLTHEDRSLHIVPYFHGLGLLSTLLAPLLAGGTVICTRDFIPSDFIPLLKTKKPTFYWGVPALHQAILQELKKVNAEELAHNSLRFIGTVSAFMPDEVRRELETLAGAPLLESYGMTEAAFISRNVPYKRGSVGIPVIESVHILDDNSEPVRPGKTGEIVIRGQVVISGYLDAPEENKTAFRNGWFYTGDMGYIDEKGYLFITGRKKELINKGGEKISPAEIDAVLRSHPGVKDAMSFQVADPLLGEDIEAMVVPADLRVSEEELRRFLLDRLVQSKVPRRIWFVDEIPKNSTGKPLRSVGTKRYGRLPQVQNPDR
jgi:acyl-CoA synthetase (AMP-forming)/AMP-acid ligase II